MVGTLFYGKPMGVNAIRGAQFRVVEVADGGG